MPVRTPRAKTSVSEAMNSISAVPKGTSSGPRKSASAPQAAPASRNTRRISSAKPKCGFMNRLIRPDRSTSPPVSACTPAAGTAARASSPNAVGSLVPYSISPNSWS
jgi:hypothetical protein